MLVFKEMLDSDENKILTGYIENRNPQLSLWFSFMLKKNSCIYQRGSGDWADSEAGDGAESHSRHTREEQLSQAGSCHPTQGSAEYFAVFYFETSVQETDPDPDARIRTVPLDYESESGSGSCYFFSGFQDAIKNDFLAYYLPTLGIFTLVFKDKNLFRSHNSVETRFSNRIFCQLMEGSGFV